MGGSRAVYTDKRTIHFLGSYRSNCLNARRTKSRGPQLEVFLIYNCVFNSTWIQKLFENSFSFDKCPHNKNLQKASCSGALTEYITLGDYQKELVTSKKHLDFLLECAWIIRLLGQVEVVKLDQNQNISTFWLIFYVKSPSGTLGFTYIFKLP